MRTTGLVLAAGGIAAVNEIVFAPAATPSGNASDLASGIDNFNWRLIPATLILAAVLGGIEELAPDFAVGLAGMTVLAVLIVPVGHAKSPVENIASTLGYGSK